MGLVAQALVKTVALILSEDVVVGTAFVYQLVSVINQHGCSTSSAMRVLPQCDEVGNLISIKVEPKCGDLRKYDWSKLTLRQQAHGVLSARMRRSQAGSSTS